LARSCGLFYCGIVTVASRRTSGQCLNLEAVTCRRFPAGRHVAQFQSADVSAHSKLRRCQRLDGELLIVKCRG
jgi:hypothetical protein